MTGQWVVGIRIEQGVNFVAHRVIGAFACIIGVQRIGNSAPVKGIKLGPAGDGIGASAYASQVGADPIGVHPAIRISCHQHAPAPGNTCCFLHGQASRMASIGMLWW